MDDVIACSTHVYSLFLVIKTAPSIAPGLAIEGIASGKIAVSVLSLTLLISSSGLLSPNIMDKANSISTIPPAI